MSADAHLPARVAPTGVIHDIGYRHYDGPRLGRGYIGRSLFVQSLRSTYGIGRTAKSKVLPMLLLGIMLLPAVVIVVVAIVTEADELSTEYTSYALDLYLVIWVYVASQAPQLFSRDLRFRTLTLYFARPLTPIDYVAARYAALVGALVILMGAPLLVMYGGAMLAGLRFGTQTRELALGLAGVVVFALVYAGIGALIASVTARRGFAVAAIITLLTLSLGVVGVVQGVAEVEGNDTVGAYAGLFSPTSLVDGFQVVVLDAEPVTSDLGPSSGLGEVLYVGLTVFLIVACFGLLVLRYRRYRA
jgi:ABC-2 type transport system permease protein